MKACLIALCVLAWSCLCQAEDLTLADGEILHEARVLRQDGESVTLSHTAGVLRVPYHRLTPELQQRFGLTPEAVEERRERALRAEQERLQAREKKMAEQRAALVASNLSPRYVTGVELASLYAAWGTLSTAGAEYLAAEWNRREALRCGLTVEAEHYREDAAKYLPQVQQEQTAARQQSEEHTALSEKLGQTQSQLEQARRHIRKLEAELAEKPSSGNTTIITSTPTVLPVYQPAPVVLPPVVSPPPPRPPVKPAPPVRPYQPARPGRILRR